MGSLTGKHHKHNRHISLAIHRMLQDGWKYASSPSGRKWLRRLFMAGLFTIAIYAFIPLVGEVRSAAVLFKRADWRFFVLALISQIVSYIFYTWLNVLSLRPFPGRVSFGNLAAVLSAMTFIQVGLPSFGASSAMLRVHLLGKFNYKPEESLVSMAVESLAEALALISVLIFGIAFIIRSGNATLLARLWVLGLLGLFLLFFGYLLWLATNPKTAPWLAAKITSSWNRWFGSWKSLDAVVVTDRLVVFRQHLGLYRRVGYWKFAAASLGKMYLDILTLGLCFNMFHSSISPGALLTGYGLILFFSALYGLATGPGSIDPFVPVIFTWFGIPAALAIAGGLTYRLIAFWSVRWIGFFCWQYLEKRSSTPHA